MTWTSWKNDAPESTKPTFVWWPASETMSNAQNAVANLLTVFFPGTLGSNPGWHFFVLDFERVGSAWRFNHSLDGAPFTQEADNPGAIMGGTAAYSLIGVIAGRRCGALEEQHHIHITGTLEPLRPRQRHNPSGAAADIFGEGLDQYESNFSAPVCWQATAKMPDGSVWRDSGSGPCPPVVRVPTGAEDVVVTDDGNPAAPRIVEG